MNKPDLIRKIKTLEALTNTEKSDLIGLLTNTKKYGLLWEDKPEEVEKDLLTKLPILHEVPELRILAKDLPVPAEKTSGNNNPNQPGLFDLVNPEQPTTNNQQPTTNNEQQTTNPEHQTPNHILIEGDNLHALTALTFTHEGKIDVIYIDPPYNTGNKDFKYNDSFVDLEDSYRHSKWLSFMHKRLQIAKRLLSDKGVIFISIDDNEQAQLKLICDEVFGEDLHIANFIWKSRQIIDSRNQSFASIDHEYVISYGKSPFSIIRGKPSDKNKYSNPDRDERGPWMSNSILGLADAENRPNLHYSIIDPENGFEYPCPESTGWRYSKDTMALKIAEKRIVFPKKIDGRPREKKFISELKSEFTGFSSIFSEEVGYTLHGTRELREIFDKAIFGFPKPVSLIRQIIQQSIPTNSTVLDFFAGSGTTLHATMQLNAEDGGNRQCILVTNNENNICEEVTWERNKRVIRGYTNAKGQEVPGLTNNNMRYYKTGFAGREKTNKNKRELTLLATELLCIKADIYTETSQAAGFTFNPKTARCFSESNKYMLVIYDEEIIEQIIPVITAIQTKHKIKIYVFAPGQYPFTEEFEEVLDKIELCALPDAIYKAYAGILPKKSDSRFSTESNQPTENPVPADVTEVDLFTANTPEV